MKWPEWLVPNMLRAKRQNIRVMSLLCVLQVSMTIPDLSSYVVLNSKLAGLGQQLQLNRYDYAFIT